MESAVQVPNESTIGLTLVLHHFTEWDSAEFLLKTALHPYSVRIWGVPVVRTRLKMLNLRETNKLIIIANWCQTEYKYIRPQFTNVTDRRTDWQTTLHSNTVLWGDHAQLLTQQKKTRDTLYEMIIVMVVITYNQCLLIRYFIIFVVCKVPIYVANIFVPLQQNSKKSKYGRKCLPYWFQTGGGRNGLKYGSSRKIREIWQP